MAEQDLEKQLEGLFSDLTDSLKAIEPPEPSTVAEELLKFKLGIERSGDAIFLTDTDGAIIYVNPAFEKIYGFSRAEALGKTPRILKSGVVPQETYRQFWQTLLAKKVVAGEIINKTKDGRIITVDGNNNPILDEEGNLIGFLAIHRDVTERKRAEEMLAKRASEFETVAQVSAAASTILDIEELLQTVVDLTKANFGLYHAHIYLLNEARDTLVLAAGAGEIGRQMVSEGQHIPSDQARSLVARAARERQGIIVNNVREDPDFLPQPLLPDTRAELAVPFIVGNEVLGVLDVQASVVNRFASEDVQIKTVLATQVAVALENARLFEEERNIAADFELQAQRLVMLNELGAELGQVTSIEDALKIATLRTPQFVPVDRVSVTVLTETGDSLKVFALQGESGAMPGDQHLPLAGTLVGKAIQEKCLLNTPNLRLSEFLDACSLADQGLASALVVPLARGEQIIGTLNVASEKPNAYSQGHEILLRQVASLLGASLESRRLFDEMQAALAETQKLYQAGRRISEASNLQEVVAAVAEAVSIATLNRVTVQTFEFDAAGELEAMVLVAAWHDEKGPPPDPVGTRYPPEVFARLDALRIPEPSFLADVQQDERLNSTAKEMFLRVNLRALGVLPLWVGTRQVGILALGFEEPHRFSEREIQSYTALARHVAPVVENKRLLEETQAALAEVEATQRHYTVQTWDKYRTRKSRLRYEKLRDDVTSVTDDLPADINQMMAHPKPMVFTTSPASSEDNGEGTAGNDRTLPAQVRSNLIMPLTVRGTVIGVLGLQETDERQWSPEEISLVEAIAEQFAQAAENLRLIDETQRRAAREARINEIGERIQAAQSLEEALQVAVKEVGLSLQAPQTIVQLDVQKED